MPKIHTMTESIAQEFMESLADTEDLEIFDSKVVRRLIEYKWPLVREHTIKKLFVPFALFLAFYVVYMNYIFYLRYENETYLILYYIGTAALTGFSLYFIALEIKQLTKLGASYFT